MSKKIYIYLLGLAVIALFARKVNGIPMPEEDDEDEDDEAPRIGGKIAGKLIGEGLEQGAKQAMKQTAQWAVKEGIERGIKEAVKAGLKVGIKGAVGGASRGLATIGKKVISSQATKMIVSGAVKVGKSKIVRTGKKFIIKIGKELVEGAASKLFEKGIEEAVTALTTTKAKERQLDLFEYLEAADICYCFAQNQCSCCAEIGEYPQACFHFVMRQSFWQSNSLLDITATFGTNILMAAEFPVDKAKDECVDLPLEDGTKVEFCVSSGRLYTLNNVQIKCFTFEFTWKETKTLKKCFAQPKDLVTFSYYPE